MESSEKQIFPFFHGVPVAPLKVIGPGGNFHLFERALVDTGAALTSVPISMCRQRIFLTHSPAASTRFLVGLM